MEAELGGAQQFFEVNATPQVVNVFVATDGATSVTPYVYVGGELAPAGAPSTAEGATFAAGALTFDPATVLDGLTTELPGSAVGFSPCSAALAAPSSTPWACSRARVGRST